jgi:peptidyl-prolyl cis-trans isomerase A (cyclophilin A)
LWRADWADTDYYVVWRPFRSTYTDSDLAFANRVERDHFFADLTQAIQQWRGKYPQFAANELKIYQGCDRNGGGFVTCQETPAVTSALPQTTAAQLGGYSKPQALIETSLGNIHCTLFPDKAPVGVANFIALATGKKDWTDPGKNAVRRGVPLYDGTIFHRVIPGFMIQGGDPLGNGTGTPGYKFENETSSDLGFDRPLRLAYANSGPGTNGSQFFITEAAADFLNGKYTIFGQCEDQDVVRGIASVPRDQSDKPLNPVVLRHIKIIEGAHGN